MKNITLKNKIKIKTGMITNFLRKRKKIIIVLFIILITAGLVFQFKNLFVVALINGKPITRIKLIQHLEAQGGKEVLNNLITEELILQEAKKQSVIISNQDIDNEISNLKAMYTSSNQSFEDLLKIQGISMRDLRNQIKLQLIMEKIIAKDIPITEDEILQYYETNKSFYPKESTYEDLKDDIRNQLLNQKLSERAQTWILELKDNANIKHFLFQ